MTRKWMGLWERVVQLSVSEDETGKGEFGGAFQGHAMRHVPRPLVGEGGSAEREAKMKRERENLEVPSKGMQCDMSLAHLWERVVQLSVKRR